MAEISLSNIIQQNRIRAGHSSRRKLKILIISNEYLLTIDEYIKHFSHDNQVNVEVTLIQVNEFFDSGKFDFIFLIYNPLNLLKNIEQLFKNNQDFIEISKEKINSDLILISKYLDTNSNFYILEFGAKNFGDLKYTAIDLLSGYFNAIIGIIFSWEKIIKIPESMIFCSKINYLSESNLRRYPKELLMNQGKLISNIILEKFFLEKKLIIFDCDGTLWNGVLGDSEFDSIKIYYEVFEFLNFLSSSGILVALSTKNDEFELRKFIESREDIQFPKNILIRANWESKSSNVAKILSLNNILQSDTIFIDDSPAELAEVTSQFPDITTLLVEKDYHEYLHNLFSLVRFFKIEERNTVTPRIESYLSNSHRENLQEQSNSYAEYLVSLSMQYKYSWDDFTHIQRCSELTKRTNQFNLTQLRLNESEIIKLVKEDNFHFLLLNLRDRFSDLGGIAFALVRVTNNHLFIENINISCRAFNRNVELLILDLIIDFALKCNCDFIFGKFIASEKNTRFKDFFLQSNFQKFSNGDFEFRYDLSTHRSDTWSEKLKFFSKDFHE